MPASIVERFADAIPLAKARDFVPGRPNISTIWRWATKGVRGVKLATVIIGGRRMVTMTALEEFLTALNGENPTAELTSDVARRARDASEALERLGC